MDTACHLMRFSDFFLLTCGCVNDMNEFMLYGHMHLGFQIYFLQPPLTRVRDVHINCVWYGQPKTHSKFS